MKLNLGVNAIELVLSVTEDGLNKIVCLCLQVFFTS